MWPNASSRALLFAALALAACGRREDEIRSYREVTYSSQPAAAEAAAPAPAATPASAPGAMSGTVPTAGLKLAWTAPEGWVEQPARAMRLATLKAGEAECVLSAFPGDTGGEEANLRRWLGQLNVEPTAEMLMAISAGAVPFKTQGGWDGRLFDLGRALPADATSGMRVAILPVSGQSVFVKLSGPPAALQAQAAALESFCKSLRPADG